MESPIVQSLKILRERPELFEDTCKQFDLGRSPKGDLKRIIRCASKRKINDIIQGKQSVTKVLEQLPTIKTADFNQLKPMTFNVPENKFNLISNHKLMERVNEVVKTNIHDTDLVKIREIVRIVGVTRSTAKSLLFLSTFKVKDIRKFLDSKFNTTEMIAELRETKKGDIDVDMDETAVSKPKSRRGKSPGKTNIKLMIKLIKSGMKNFDIQKRIGCDSLTIKNVRFVLDLNMEEVTDLLYHVPISKVVRIAETFEKKFSPEPETKENIISVPDLIGGKINVKTLKAYEEFLNQIISDRNLHWRYTDKENITSKLTTILNIINLT